MLKKGWYFYSPTILKSNQKSFNFLDEFESSVEESVPFSEVVDISEFKGEVILSTLSKRIKLKVPLC